LAGTWLKKRGLVVCRYLPIFSPPMREEKEKWRGLGRLRRMAVPAASTFGPRLGLLLFLPFHAWGGGGEERKGGEKRR